MAGTSPALAATAKNRAATPTTVTSASLRAPRRKPTMPNPILTAPEDTPGLPPTSARTVSPTPSSIPTRHEILPPSNLAWSARSLLSSGFSTCPPLSTDSLLTTFEVPQVQRAEGSIHRFPAKWERSPDAKSRGRGKPGDRTVIGRFPASFDGEHHRLGCH